MLMEHAFRYRFDMLWSAVPQSFWLRAWMAKNVIYFNIKGNGSAPVAWPGHLEHGKMCKVVWHHGLCARGAGTGGQQSGSLWDRFECSKSEPSLAGDGEEPDRAKRAKRQLWPILLLQLWVSKLFPEPSSSSVFESHLFLHRVCHDRTCWTATLPEGGGCAWCAGWTVESAHWCVLLAPEAFPVDCWAGGGAGGFGSFAHGQAVLRVHEVTGAGSSTSSTPEQRRVWRPFSDHCVSVNFSPQHVQIEKKLKMWWNVKVQPILAATILWRPLLLTVSPKHHGPKKGDADQHCHCDSNRLAGSLFGWWFQNSVYMCLLYVIIYNVIFMCI